MSLVVFATILDLYNGTNSLRYIFTIEKNSQPALDKFQYDAYIQYYIRKMEDKYRKENKRIREICDEHNSTLSFDFNNNDTINKQNTLMKNIWIDGKHRLAYWPNAKLKRLFLSILNITTHINMENILRNRGNIVWLIKF